MKSRPDSDAYSVTPSMISAMSSASMAGVVKKHDYGKLHLSVHYKQAKQILQVVVIAARLNKTPGSPGLPNPYTKLYMVPDPSKKSKVKLFSFSLQMGFPFSPNKSPSSLPTAKNQTSKEHPGSHFQRVI